MVPFPEHGPDEGLLMGARNIEPVNGGGDWVVLEARALDLRGDGREARRQHSRPDRLGVSRRPAQASRAWRSSPGARPGWEARRRSNWTATIYPGPKENFVFNASTIFWAQGLSSPPGHTLALVALVAPPRAR